MSASITIWCDLKIFDQFVECDQFVDTDAMTLKAARKSAHMKGWKVWEPEATGALSGAHIDVCPECAQHQRKQHNRTKQGASS